MGSHPENIKPRQTGTRTGKRRLTEPPKARW